MKLLNVERSINIYRKTNSDLEGEEVGEIPVDHIPVETLKEIDTANEDDPLLYHCYWLNDFHISKFNSLLETRIIPDFELYDYLLICLGIYDWDAK